jgi:small-conductance mechanosensitive channel
MYRNIIESFENFWASVIVRLPDILVSLVVLIIFIFIGKLTYRIFKQKIQSRWKDSVVSSFLGEFVKWAFYIIGFTIALFNLGLGGVASSLIAGAGVTAIIIGFAFKDIAENFLAGILLAINRPFNIGDIIEVGGVKGPVQGLDLRTTHIKTADGRDIYIPNSMAITNVFTNYTKDGFLRLDFLVGLDTFDDIEKARKIIIDHLVKQNDILKSPVPNVSLEELGESSITIKVMFWTNIFKAAKKDQTLLGEPIKSRIMREVKDLLLSSGFNMPAQIVEHKMYQEDKPLTVGITSQ